MNVHFDVKRIYNSLSKAQKENLSGVGLGKKQIEGEFTDQKAVVFFVEKKKDEADLGGEEILPDGIGGFPTDVQETGKITALADKKKYRPAAGGCSAMYAGGTACTLGCVVYRDGEPHILGNQHCFFPLFRNVGKKAPILQPSPYDGGGKEDIIAEAWDVVPFDENGFNKVDAALAKVIDEKEVDPLKVLELGYVKPQTVSAKVGMKVRKRGRTTGYTEAKVRTVHAIAKVHYDTPQGEKAFLFSEQTFLGPNFIDGGDSSSLVVDKENRPVGLAFAGSDRISIINQIDNVTEALNFNFKLPMNILDKQLNRESIFELYRVIHRREPSEDAISYWEGDTLGDFIEKVKSSEEYKMYTPLYESAKEIENWGREDGPTPHKPKFVVRDQE